MSEPISVMLLDSQDLVRGGIRSALADEPGITVAAEAATVRRAVELISSVPVDVVITDAWVADRNEQFVAEAIRSAAGPPAPHIVVLASTDSDSCFFQAMKCGVSGYLLKNVSRQELAYAVRAAAAGHAVICPRMTRRLFDRFQILPARASGIHDYVLGGLSARELDVLSRLAAGRSNQEIADDLFLTTATVKSHVSRVLSKLGLRDRVGAALLAYQVGLVQFPVSLPAPVQPAERRHKAPGPR